MPPERILMNFQALFWCFPISLMAKMEMHRSHRFVYTMAVQKHSGGGMAHVSFAPMKSGSWFIQSWYWFSFLSINRMMFIYKLEQKGMISYCVLGFFFFLESNQYAKHTQGGMAFGPCFLFLLRHFSCIDSISTINHYFLGPVPLWPP